MDCPRCGAPLSSDDRDCPYCGRGRDAPQAPVVQAPAASSPSIPLTGTGFWIVDLGKNKIAVIGALRDALGLGLREAKELVDAAVPIRINVATASDVAKVMDAVREAGAEPRLLLPR